MSEQVGIIGDGQMGLVLAQVLAEQGHRATIWGPFPEDLASLKESRRSPRLPGFALDPRVEIESSLVMAITNASVLVNAIPTQFIRSVWEKLRGELCEEPMVVCVSKGVEEGSFLTPLEVIAEALGEPKDLTGRPMVCVSGPTIATELAERKPATLVAASNDAEACLRTQAMLSTAWLRVYSHDDVKGVEIAGAVKNIIALAAGMVDGMNLGHNAKSALLARGLAEITRLGLELGARQDTFFGVAGVGDLATTCFSPDGRNRTCGEALGRGESLEDILAATQSVVEGVATTRSVAQLARQRGIDMPITFAVHAILFEGLMPADAIRGLMGRDLKPERIV